MAYRYWEAINMTVTSAEAKAEIEKHDGDWSEFTTEFGEHEEYEGRDVLDFLGY